MSGAEEEEEAAADAEAATATPPRRQRVPPDQQPQRYRDRDRRGAGFGWHWRQSASRFVRSTTSAPAALAGGVFDAQGNSVVRRKYHVCDGATGQRIAGKQAIAPLPPQQALPLVCKVYLAPHLTAAADDECRPTVRQSAHDDDDDEEEEEAPSSQMLIMAAGVLFFATRPESAADVYFLLGKEQYHPQWPDSLKWADCGGGVDPKDADIVETAAREAWEEGQGCIQTYEELLTRLRNGEAQAVFDIQTADGVGGYRIYVLGIPYEDYNSVLMRMRAYLRRHRIHVGDAEKTALEWVHAQELVEIARQCEAGQNTLLRPNFAKSILAMASLFDVSRLADAFGGARGASHVSTAGGGVDVGPGAAAGAVARGGAAKD